MMYGLIWFGVGFWVGVGTVLYLSWNRLSEKPPDNDETSEQVIGETEHMIGALERRRPLRRREELWQREIGDILNEGS